MARERRKSWIDIENQKNRILDRIGHVGQRAQRVENIADRYQENIFYQKSDLNRQKKMIELRDAATIALMNGNRSESDRLNAQADAIRYKNGYAKWSRRAYMSSAAKSVGLSAG